MSKVGTYARVSSEDKAERGTIDNQLKFARKYCDLHQLDVYEWYKDDGITGTLPLEQRPSGQRLIEDAKAGKFNLLLIYRLDRLGRSARAVFNAVHDLDSFGVKVRSMTEPFDIDTPAGKWLGGIVPYGYYVNEAGFLEVNENNLPGTYKSEADVVRLIFNLIVENHYHRLKL